MPHASHFILTLSYITDTDFYTSLHLLFLPAFEIQISVC